MKQATRIVNVLYCLTVIFFLLDEFTYFDIKNQIFKSFVYFGFLIGTPTTLLWNFFSQKTKINRITGSVYPALFLILIITANPATILFSSSAWHTQTILYEHGHLKFKKVEFQMRDIGTFGYKRRQVAATYLTPFFMITSKMPDDIDKRTEWIKTDRDVNELKLKSP